jgi:hypothetical protein
MNTRTSIKVTSQDLARGWIDTHYGFATIQWTYTDDDGVEYAYITGEYSADECGEAVSYS